MNDHPPSPGKEAPDALIRGYYDGLNARRFDEAAQVFASEAMLEYLPLGEPLRGRHSSVEFARRWLEACPDGRFRIERVEQRGDLLCEVDLIASGTHIGRLDLGMYQFKPSQVAVTIRLRQLFEFRNGRVIFSSVSFDVHDLVRQLASVDYGSLQRRLHEIGRLSHELSRAEGDPHQRREICDRLGRELDAARQVIRPYFYR